MTGANKGGGNGFQNFRFQNKSLVFGGLFKGRNNDKIRGDQLHIFLLSFFNKYKLLGHYNASTALDVCKLHLYKAMCVFVCVFYKELCRRSARKKKNKHGSRGCRGKSYGCPRVNMRIVFFPLDPPPSKKTNIFSNKNHRASLLKSEQSHGTSLFCCA